MTKELDKQIGKEETDQDGRKFKIINGRKIYQAEQKTERERLINQAINRIRASRT